MEYKEVFSDPVLRSSLIHPLILFGFYCVLPVITALILSTALTTVRRGHSFFRVTIFLPFVVPGVVAALIWQFMYEPQNGLLTSFSGTSAWGASLSRGSVTSRSPFRPWAWSGRGR